MGLADNQIDYVSKSLLLIRSKSVIFDFSLYTVFIPTQLSKVVLRKCRSTRGSRLSPCVLSRLTRRP